MAFLDSRLSLSRSVHRCADCASEATFCASRMRRCAEYGVNKKKGMVERRLCESTGGRKE